MAGVGMSPEVREPEPDRGESTGTPGRDLTAAIATGLLLGAVFVGSVLVAPIAFTGFVAALILAALVEAAHVLRAAARPVAMPVLLVGTPVVLAAAHVGGAAGQAFGALALVVATVVWVIAQPHARRDAVACAGTTLLMGMWVPFLGSYAVLLATMNEHAVVATLATIGAAILADIGAYAVGTLAGRHRIAPHISPNKTWEGLAGGLVVAAAGAALALPPVDDVFDPLTAAGFALAVGTAGFFGDLFESMVKRDLGVKDFGSLLPGHGGVLDRVDGILLALPVGYAAIALIR